MDISVITESLIKLFIVIAIGYIAAKSGYLSEKIAPAISKVIVKITLPILIVTSMMSKELSHDTLINTGIVVIAAIVIMMFLYIVGIATAKLFRLREPTKTIHAQLTTTGNVVFMGYPVITAVFGVDGLYYAVIYGIINDLALWSVGVYLINKSTGKVNSKDAFKKLLNPNTISCVVGILFMLLRVKLPPVLFDTLSGVGHLTTDLSMIFIGMMLAGIDMRKIYKRVSMLSIVVTKMIIAPVVVAVLLKLIGVDYTTAGAIVLQVAMPAQSVMSIITNEADSDVTYAVEYIFLSLILSAGTLPLVYYLMQSLI